MSLLTEKLNDCFKFNGQTYHVNMAYDNILRVFEMFQDEFVSEWERIELALEMLIVEYSELVFESLNEKVELFQSILKKFLGYDFSKPKTDEPPQYDFNKDAELIFASFFSAYKMDLIQMQGELHWKKFVALLNNLDEDTAFKKVVGYRTAKIPPINEHNKEQVKRLRELKELYSLDDTTPEEKMNNAFSAVAHALKGSAKVGE